MSMKPSPLMQAFVPPQGFTAPGATTPASVKVPATPVQFTPPRGTAPLSPDQVPPLSPTPQARPSSATMPLQEPDRTFEAIPDRGRRAARMSLDDIDLTPLMRAVTATAANVQIQDLLNDGADPDEQNSLGWTALMIAAAQDNVLAVYTLLQVGADMAIRDRADETALDKAIKAGNSWIVRLLTKVRDMGSAEALSVMPSPFPTKRISRMGARDNPFEKAPKLSILTSWALKPAGQMPAQARPGDAPRYSTKLFDR